MARQNTTAPAEQGNTNKGSEYTGLYELKNVTWAPDNKSCRFTLALPCGISLYGCRLRYKKDGEGFIAPAQDKGKDGKWYSRYFLRLNPGIEAAIIDQLEAM